MKKFLSLIIISFVLISCLASCKKTVTIGTKTLDVSKNFTILISQSLDKESLNQMRKGFVKGMVDKGYAEGVNVTYIYENAKGDKTVADKIADLAVEKKPDLIVTIGEISTLSMKNKIKYIPIVFLGCMNADRIGLCNKDLTPIDNLTGVKDSHMLEESLSFITDNYPNVKKLGIIFDSNNSLSSNDVDFLKFYATGYDIDIYTVAIKKAADIGKALDNIMPKVDALILTIDDMINEHSDEIFVRATKERKPVFGLRCEVDDERIVETATPDKSLVGREGADIVSTILKGESKLKDISIREVK